MGSRIAVFAATLIAIAVALGLAMQQAQLASDSDPTVMADAYFERVNESAASACGCKQDSGDDECYAEYRRLVASYPNVANMEACAPVAGLRDCYETDSGMQCVFNPQIVVGNDGFALCSQNEVEVYESHFDAASTEGISVDDAAAIAADAVRNDLAPISGFSGCG